MTGPKYRPRCAVCGRELVPSLPLALVGFERCPAHPYARAIYRLQEARGTYPAGWPRCAICGEPALDGKQTCGDTGCTSALLADPEEWRT
jgi:hypothetical protein